MLVTLDKICKSFLDEVVLRDVSFSINENERIGLLGGYSPLTAAREPSKARLK